MRRLSVISTAGGLYRSDGDGSVEVLSRFHIVLISLFVQREITLAI